MGANSFNEFTETITQSRRGALKTLFAAAVVGAFTVRSGSGAAADDQCKPQGKKCVKDAQCCAPGIDNAHAVCTGDAPTGNHKHGLCGYACDDGYKDCNGTCIPVDACCDGCPPGSSCQSGECVDDPVCVPVGGPCNLNDPGACCSKACLSLSGGSEGTCF